MRLHEYPLLPAVILLIQLIYVLLYIFTDFLPSSPYGRHNYQALPAFQISASPLFMHNSDWPFKSFLLQFFALLSPLSFELTSGARTKVILGISEVVNWTCSFTVLTLLFILYRNVSRDDPRANFKFTWNFFGLLVMIYCIRMLIGLISYHIGRNILPALCFSDAMREVSRGFTPASLAMYLVLQARLSEDTGLVFTNIFRTPLTYFNLILALLCFSVGNSLWWNGTGLFVGLLFALLNRSDGTHQYSPVDSSETVKHPSSTKSRVLKRFAILLTIMLVVYWTKLPSPFKGSHELLSVGAPIAPLLTLIVITAPRKNGANHLQQTVQSFLDAFPESPSDPLYNRLKMVVFTHFTDNLVFDLVKQEIGSTKKSNNYIEWVKFPGSEFNQRKHFDAAIRHTVLKLHPKTFYFGIIEDDFPLCPGKWPQVLRLIRDANKKYPKHCGVFIGTGGAGLLIKREKYEMVLKEMHSMLPPDSAMHYCLKGSGCPGCELVVPSTMLLYHTGHASSTMGHTFGSDMYQCGARHPFIDNLDAIVL